MNKTAKTAMITALMLCVVGMVLSTAGYFAGGKDFNDSSGHVYVSGGTDSARKNLEVMEKQQINAFTKLNVDFQNFDLDIRKSGDDCYYMEYRMEKGGNENPLTWENKDGELTLQETSGGKGSYYISYDLGNLLHHTETQKQEEINTVILYVPQDARVFRSQDSACRWRSDCRTVLMQKYDSKLFGWRYDTGSGKICRWSHYTCRWRSEDKSQQLRR